MTCTIDNHTVGYRIFTSMTDVKNADIQDTEFEEFLKVMGWDTDDYDFMYPIVRIYIIVDEDGKPIDVSFIKYDMRTFCLFINDQFKSIDYPDPPIYFTSVQYMKSIVSNYNEQSKEYKNALAYKCMQFEWAGFFNIKALIKSDKAISFVYGNKSAHQVYLELFKRALI